jgi:PAS domain S-box-containing protein
MTENRQAMEALRASEENYRLLFKSNPIPLWVYDIDTLAFLAVNDFAVEHYGYSREEFLGMTIKDVRLPEDVPYLHQVLTGHTGALRRVGSARHRKKDGTLIDVDITGHELEFEGHQAMLVLAMDITERKRVEAEIELYRDRLEELVEQRTAELKAANEQLLVLSRVKDEFVSNVSHELRTPISSIKLRQFLARSHPERLEEHLEVIKRETERLARTIEDLLQLSRLDQRRTEFHPTLVDLNVLVNQYVTDRAPIAADRNLTLTFQGECNLPAIVADAGMLGQALSVLLTNAFNYTPVGGQVSVRTYTRQCEGKRWVGFGVSDTGFGISPEDQSRLFGRFFRGAAGRKFGVPGTGLGLAIAQEIVRQHSGHIEVDSDGVPGHGTSFKVWIPGEEQANDRTTHHR